MNAIGHIKFTNSREHIFGFVTVVNSIDGTKGVDAFFLVKNYISEEILVQTQTLVLLDLVFKDGKYRANRVQPLLESSSEDIVRCLSIFEPSTAIDALKLLKDRDIKFSEDVIACLFDALSKFQAYNFRLPETWKLIKYINREDAYRRFYELINEKFFISEWYKKSYELIDWFFNDGLDEFFVKRAKVERNPVLTEIFQHYDIRQEFDKAKDLIDFMPRDYSQVDELRMIYYAINYIADPNDIITLALKRIRLPENALMVLLERSYKITAINYAKVANLILQEIFRRNGNCFYKDMKALYEKNIEVDISIRSKFIMTLLELSYKNGISELLLLFPQLLKRYHENRFEILNFILIELKLREKVIFDNIPQEIIDADLVYWISAQFPDFYDLSPAFYIRVIDITRIKLFDASDTRIMNTLIYAAEKSIAENDVVLRDAIFDYYLSRFVEGGTNQAKLAILSGFVFSRYQILQSISDYLDHDGKETIHFIFDEVDELVSTGVLGGDVTSIEVKFLLSMMGVYNLSAPELQVANFKSIADKIGYKTEFALIQFLASLTLRFDGLCDRFTSFINEYEFHSFESIVVIKMLTSTDPQKNAISNLNQAFLAAYSNLIKIGKKDIREYFTTDRLAKRCQCRRAYSYPEKKIIDEQEELVVSDTVQLYSKEVTYCEGRYWKTENYLFTPRLQRRDIHLYYCRGSVCIAPNNKSYPQAHYLLYSLVEIAATQGIKFTDIVQATIGGWLNRIEEIIELLKCYVCNSLLVPISFMPDNLGHYGTPLFKCPRVTCSAHQQIIRITHCRGCGKILDSRANEECKNHWLVCDNCRTCCTEHSKGGYIPHYRQKDNDDLPF